MASTKPEASGPGRAGPFMFEREAETMPRAALENLYPVPAQQIERTTEPLDSVSEITDFADHPERQRAHQEQNTNPDNEPSLEV